jgi:hypothetical protein
MKNLQPLKRNAAYLKKIIDGREEPYKTDLTAIIGTIHTNYKTFVSRCTSNTLEKFTASAFAAPHDVNLRGCYADTVSVKKLKDDIYANQPAHIRYECQYCMIGNSDDSFDHYLPKQSFPEFAVLSNNLIPCCAKCNSKKSEYWYDNAQVSRGIINFYYDQLPNIQFLQCNIHYVKGVPSVTFSLNNPGGVIPIHLFQVIELHYAKLELFKRFSKKFNREVTNAANSLAQFIGIKNRTQAAAFLLADANQMKLSYGQNFWIALIREQLAGSNNFLTQAGF